MSYFYWTPIQREKVFEFDTMQLYIWGHMVRILWLLPVYNITNLQALATGALEYTDCISAKE